MVTINPYLNFNGNTEEAFTFYKSVFGGEFIAFQRFNDVPNLPGEVVLSESDKQKLMHVALPIGKGNILMATDILESLGQSLTVGNNYSLSIDAESEAEATNLFNALAVDGTITMPFDKASWGAYFGMVIDKFGIQWMVNYDPNKHELNS